MLTLPLWSALFPPVPFYKERLFGIPKVWQKLVGVQAPLIPLVPPVARSNIPRSNPQKRKMPIEFLNSRSTKKFRSDVSAPLQPGGSGGQFAAATVKKANVDVARDTEQEAATVPADFSSSSYRFNPKTGKLEGAGRAQFTTRGKTTVAEAGFSRDIGSTKQSTKPTSSPLGSGVTGDHTRTKYHLETKPVDASSIIGGQTKASHRETSRYAQPEVQFAGNIKGDNMTTPTKRDTPGQPGIFGRDPKRSTSVSLPVYPDPSKREARKRIASDFPNGWVQAPTEVQHLFASATLALEFSINRQLGKFNNLQTTHQHLGRLAQSQPALKPYTQMGGPNTFDIYCLALLAEVFGEENGLKIQLGVAQEHSRSPGDLVLRNDAEKKMVPYLVGSKYNDDTDKVVVWVRLVQLDKYQGGLINPYSKQPYNCYKGIGFRTG